MKGNPPFLVLPAGSLLLNSSVLYTHPSVLCICVCVCVHVYIFVFFNLDFYIVKHCSALAFPSNNRSLISMNMNFIFLAIPCFVAVPRGIGEP